MGKVLKHTKVGTGVEFFFKYLKYGKHSSDTVFTVEWTNESTLNICELRFKSEI